MSKLNLGGHGVKFTYATVNKQIREGVTVNKKTITCDIFTKEDEWVATSTVSLHHKDLDNKSVGRHFAFKDAVSQIINKDQKRAIWDDYRVTVNSPARLSSKLLTADSVE